MKLVQKAGAALSAVCLALALASSVQAQPKSITLSAGAVGQHWYMLAALLGEDLKKTYSATQITVMAGGGVANVNLLDQGTIDFGLTSTELYAAALKGAAPYKKVHKDLMAVANIQAESVYYFMVDKAKGLKSIEEYAKKKMPLRFCTFRKAGPPAVSALRLFEEYGVKEQDISKWGGKINFMDWSDCVSLARDGHVDAIVGGTGLPSPFHAEIANARQVDLLPVPEPIIQKMKEKYGYIRVDIPKGTYNVAKENIPSFGWSGYLLTRTKTPEKVVYDVAKSLHENADRIRRLHSGLAAYDVKKLTTDIPGPIHPGAVRFYKEKGLLK
ncbi:MAG: TAXI family TRAP transporter solute-binding subunit [Candidatus Tectomicrobia bacterium]|nr:TAXI family TRAP transporter solute-binding subunit [Candidatus Tectomicrobia bacterium]